MTFIAVETDKLAFVISKAAELEFRQHLLRRDLRLMPLGFPVIIQVTGITSVRDEVVAGLMT